MYHDAIIHNRGDYGLCETLEYIHSEPDSYGVTK
jgi:hypothetical protein